MTEEVVTQDNYKGITDAIKDLKASIDTLNESLAPLSTLKGKDGVSNLSELVESSTALLSSLSKNNDLVKALDAIASKVSGGSSSSEVDKGELIQTIVTKVASWLVKLMV